jgi:hypothetical protein
MVTIITIDSHGKMNYRQFRAVKVILGAQLERPEHQSILRERDRGDLGDVTVIHAGKPGRRTAARQLLCGFHQTYPDGRLVRHERRAM